MPWRLQLPKDASKQLRTQLPYQWRAALSSGDTTCDEGWPRLPRPMPRARSPRCLQCDSATRARCVVCSVALCLECRQEGWVCMCDADFQPDVRDHSEATYCGYSYEEVLGPGTGNVEDYLFQHAGMRGRRQILQNASTPHNICSAFIGQGSKFEPTFAD